MTAPGGVIATVYVRVLPQVKSFASDLRRQLRASSRELRRIDREIEPVNQALRRMARLATGIVPGIRLARAGLLSLGGSAVVGGLLSAAGAVASLSGALFALPAIGVAAASGLGALSVGLFGVQDTMKQFFKNVDKFHKKLADLSENAQKTIGVFDNFRDKILEFRNAVQDRLFAGLDEVAKNLLTTFLPRLTEHFGNIADVVNAAAKDLANFVTQADTLKDIDTTTSNVERAFSTLKDALRPAATALRDLVVTGSDFLPTLAEIVVRLVTHFAEWISAMRQSGELWALIDTGIAKFQQLGRIVGNIGRAVAALFGAAKDSGNGFLDTLEQLTDKLADFLQAPATQNRIKDFLDTTRQAALVLTPVLVALGDFLFGSLLPTLTLIGTEVGPTVARIFSALGDALDSARPGIQTFASGFATFLQALLPLLPLLGHLLNSLGTLVGVLAAKLGPVIADIAAAIANVLIPVVDALTGFFLFLDPAALKVVVALGATVVAVATLITVVRGFQAIAGLFAGGLQLMTGGALKTQGAVGGLAGFLSGPWGIAIGLATTALGFFLSTTDKAQDDINGLQSAMESATGSAEKAGDEWIRQKAEQEGVAATASKYRISITELIDAYKGVPGAVENASKKIQENGDVANANGAETKRLIDFLFDSGDAYNKAVDGANRKKQADQEGMTAAESAAAAFEKQRDALNELYDALQRQQQLQLNSLNSQLAYQTQIIQTTNELTNETTGIDINTQAGQDNLKALADLAAAGQRRVNDLIQQNASTAVVNQTILEQREALLNLLQPYFATREAAEKYAISIGLIPDIAQTKVVLDWSAAQQNLAAYQRALDNIPRVITTSTFVRGANINGSGGHMPLTNALGGPLPAGQWSWVGENGPELVRFSRSARVFSNQESMDMVRDVGGLDTMTSRASYGRTDAVSTGASTTATPTQIDNYVTVEPTVKVYVDGQELRGMVRVELDQRDQKLRRLVTSGTGGR